MQPYHADMWCQKQCIRCIERKRAGQEPCGKGKFAARALLGLLMAPMAGPAQREQNPQQPRFNVQVNLVSLDVEVLDPSGNPVLGLTQNDFSIKEGGKPVDISHFAWQSERPVSLAIVLDTSAISTEKLTRCKRFIVELAHRLARTDEICLFTFDTRDAYLEQDFTPSRLRIVEALENIGVPAGKSGGVLKELFGKQPLTGLAIDLALKKVRAAPKGKKALLVISNRFRGLGPVTVEHIRESDCTLSLWNSTTKRPAGQPWEATRSARTSSCRNPGDGIFLPTPRILRECAARSLFR